MTLQYALIRMATIGQISGLTGLMPGAQTTALSGPDGTLAMESASTPGADVARYVIGFQEMAPIRHVPPPSPPPSGLLGGKVAAEFDQIPGNASSSLGSATDPASGLE